VAVSVLHLVGPVTNGTISLLTHYRLANVPSVQRPSYLAWDGLRPVLGGVFQVVKTAQSRERTERTLLKALSQLQWPDNGREVWSRRAPRLAGAGGTTKRPVASVCTNCETAFAVVSALRRRPPRGAGMLRTGVIRRFYCHSSGCYTQVITPTSADAFPVVGSRCTGRARRCKVKQGRRGKTALTFGYLLTQ
jgi:hypothetical protein